jgi:hypothetical protein
MALSRFDTPYQPKYVSQFVPQVDNTQLIANSVLARQQRYDASANAASQMQAELAASGNIRAVDMNDFNKRFNQLTSELDQEIGDKYQGDYALGAHEVFKRLSNERSNPFYNYAQQASEDEKAFRMANMQAQTQGRQLHVYKDKDGRTKTVIDPETNQPRSVEFKFEPIPTTNEIYDTYTQLLSNWKPTDMGGGYSIDPNFQKALIAAGVDPEIASFQQILQISQTKGITIPASFLDQMAEFIADENFNHYRILEDKTDSDTAKKRIRQELSAFAKSFEYKDVHRNWQTLNFTSDYLNLKKAKAEEIPTPDAWHSLGDGKTELPDGKTPSFDNLPRRIENAEKEGNTALANYYRSIQNTVEQAIVSNPKLIENHLQFKDYVNNVLREDVLAILEDPNVQQGWNSYQKQAYDKFKETAVSLRDYEPNLTVGDQVKKVLSPIGNMLSVGWNMATLSPTKLRNLVNINEDLDEITRTTPEDNYNLLSVGKDPIKVFGDINQFLREMNVPSETVTNLANKNQTYVNNIKSKLNREKEYIDKTEKEITKQLGNLPKAEFGYVSRIDKSGINKKLENMFGSVPLSSIAERVGIEGMDDIVATNWAPKLKDANVGDLKFVLNVNPVEGYYLSLDPTYLGSESNKHNIKIKLDKNEYTREIAKELGINLNNTIFTALSQEPVTLNAAGNQITITPGLYNPTQLSEQGYSEPQQGTPIATVLHYNFNSETGMLDVEKLLDLAKDSGTDYGLKATKEELGNYLSLLYGSNPTGNTGFDENLTILRKYYNTRFSVSSEERGNRFNQVYNLGLIDNLITHHINYMPGSPIMAMDGMPHIESIKRLQMILKNISTSQSTKSN